MKNKYSYVFGAIALICSVCIIFWHIICASYSYVSAVPSSPVGIEYMLRNIGYAPLFLVLTALGIVFSALSAKFSGSRSVSITSIFLILSFSLELCFGFYIYYIECLDVVVPF